MSELQNPVTGVLREYDKLKDLFDAIDPEIREIYRKKVSNENDDPTVVYVEKIRAQARMPGVVALVLFKNMQVDSSEHGRTSVLRVGAGCTYTSVEAVADQHLGDLPSRFQYPIGYFKVTRPGVDEPRMSIL